MEKETPAFIGSVPVHGTPVPCAYIYRQIGTGKEYVGSTVDGYSRFVKHTAALARGEHPNRNFQAAYDESPVFEVEMIQVPPNRSHEEQVSVVRQMEQTLIDQRQGSTLLLNISKDTRSFAKGLRFSEESRAKISKAMKERVVSQETRQRRSATMTGISHTEERKANISISKTKRAVQVADKVYRNVAEAAKELGFANKGSVRFRCLSPSYPDFTFIDQVGNAPSL
jgi:group I intron endonuclease